MTASLPVPHDPSDDEGAPARPAQLGPRPLPPPPVIPAAEAARRAADDVVAVREPQPGKSRPVRKAFSRKRAPRAAPVVDPGPPPPLPADLSGFVIPPKPPLPVGDVTAPDIVVPPKPPAPVLAPEAPEPEPVEPETLDPDLMADAADTAPPLETPADGAALTEVETAPVPPADPVDELLLTDTPVESTPIEVRREAVASVFDSEFATPTIDVDSAALSLQGVTKIFGETRAVDGIDLVVPAGVFYGLVGPNGAGKTTTLSMIAGLLRPDRGSITVNGVDAAAKPRVAKKLMGVLPDRLRTFDRLTGRQLLYYFGVLRGLPSAVVESRTADLARAFDLVEALSRPVSDYSAGMTKKVMLAGAMIHSPRLLVLDEPFESVDPVSSGVILDILGAYVAHGGTVVLSSHGMDLVERVCSRVAVMVAGQILAEGTIDEVRGELTLEQRFVELAGGLSDVEGLEWLHTFSG